MNKRPVFFVALIASLFLPFDGYIHASNMDTAGQFSVQKGRFGVDAISLASEKQYLKTVSLMRSRKIDWKVRPDEKLIFFYGVFDHAYKPKQKRVFQFEVNVKDGKQKTNLFTAQIDPGMRSKDKGWQGGEVALDRFAGKDVQLLFQAYVAGEKGLVEVGADMALWGGVRIGNFRRNIDDKSLILISIDTQRADRLGAYGYKRNTSPNIDRMAREGVLFLQAISPANWTLPAHMSIFTSMYPMSHLVHDYKSGNRQLADSIVTLSEVFQQNGYLTYATTGDAYVSTVYGFFRGFDIYEETLRNKIIMDDQSLKKTKAEARFQKTKNRKSTTDSKRQMNNLIRFIESQRDRKFFAFFHTYDVHEPYMHAIPEFLDPKKKPSDAELLSAKYDSGIRYVDQQIGRLRDKLEELNLTDNVVVIITSDHGEELSDRGYHYAHHLTFYDDQIHVPLLFFAPSRFSPRVVKNYQASTVDIMPTVMDIFKFPHLDKQEQGHSLFNLLNGEKEPLESMVFSNAIVFGGVLAAVRYASGNERYKLVMAPYVHFKAPEPPEYSESEDDKGKEWKYNYWNKKVIPSGGIEFYNLKKDPLEKNDIASKKGKMFEFLYGQLTSFLELQKAHAAHAGSIVPVEKSPYADEILEKLKALGY